MNGEAEVEERAAKQDGLGGDMSILPNKQEKDFMKAVMDFHINYGVGYLYGDEWHGEPIQCHHVAGRTYKHNKVHIGHWFILPIPFDLHDVSSNHELNVTHWRNRFTGVFGVQRGLWSQMIMKMTQEGALSHFDINVMNAIMDSKY
jgi:hypothetical protein